MKRHSSTRIVAVALALLMLASVFTGLSVSAAGITFTVQNVTIGGCLYPVPNADPYAMKSTIYGNAGDEGADVVDFWWFNETAGAKVPDNGNVKFQSNNVYSLYVVIKAVELDEDSNSYTFPNSFKSTRFWFSNNNNERGKATATQYEDKPLNQYRLLSWTSISLPEIKITELRLEGVKTVLNPDTEGLIAGKPVSALTASAGNLVDSEGVPIAGGEPNYTVVGYSTYVYDDSAVEWVEVTDPEAKFEAENKYKFTATLKANEPYYFSTNASGKPNVDAIWAYGPTSALTMTNNKIATTTNTNDTLTLTYEFPKVSAVKIPITNPYLTFYTTPYYYDKVDYSKLTPAVSEGLEVTDVKVMTLSNEYEGDWYAAAESDFTEAADGDRVGGKTNFYADLSESFNNCPRYVAEVTFKVQQGYSVNDLLDNLKVYGGYDVTELTYNKSFFVAFDPIKSEYYVYYFFQPEINPNLNYGASISYKDYQFQGKNDILGGANANEVAEYLMTCASIRHKWFTDKDGETFYYGSQENPTLTSVSFTDLEGNPVHGDLVGGKYYYLVSKLKYPYNTRFFEPETSYDKLSMFWASTYSFADGDDQFTVDYVVASETEKYAKVTIKTEVKVYTDKNAGESCKWEFDSSDGTLYIKGTGDMYGYALVDTKPWELEKEKIKKVVINDGITSVGKRTFNDLPNLERVVLANSVTKIDDYAFQNDEKLSSLSLSSGLTEIGSGVFENTALTEVELPSKLNKIGDHAFENTGLTSVAIPAAVTTIGAGAFQNVKLAEINLPAALTEIGEFAFVGATDTEVTVPESVTSIGAYALGYSSVKQIPGEGDAPSTWEGTPVEGFKIIAQAGTAAYRYATGNNITVERTNLVVKFDNKLEYEIMGETYKYGSVQEKFCAADEEVTIPKQTTTVYDMYTFGGWKIEGEDTIYQGGETYKVTKDVTFKAIWTSTPVVTYEDGNGNKRTDVIPSTGEYKFMRCYFTAPEGMAFGGWLIGETIYQPGDKITVNENVTAKAVWKDAYTISFDGDGAAGEMSTAKVAKDAEYTFPECGFTAPEGKAFAGWLVGETTYSAGDKITITENITAKAVWADAVTVTFDGNGAEGTMDAVTVGKDCDYILPECGFTVPTGKAFEGWQIGDNTCAAGDKVKVTENITVKAMWETGLTVSFEANGAEGTMASVKVVKGSEYTLPECGFTAPENKEFNGWKIGETVYKAGDKITVDDTVIAIATWKDKAPEVVDISGFTVEGIKDVTYTGKAITQKIAVKNGETALTADTDYTVKYKNNKNAGTATVTITGKGAYTGTITKTFKINKAANKMKVTASKKAQTVKFTAKVKKGKKYKTVKLKSVTVKAITVKNAVGKVSYKLTSVPNTAKKYVTISSKGVITVKKGVKKGKYTLKVKVTAKGDKSYKKGSNTVKVIIQVK